MRSERALSRARCLVSSRELREQREAPYRIPAPVFLSSSLPLSLQLELNLSLIREILRLFFFRVKSFYFSSVYKTLSAPVMAASAKRKQEEKHLKMLREMTSLPPNRKCFDCDQRGPTYADMTTGSFVCTSCSGIL